MIRKPRYVVALIVLCLLTIPLLGLFRYDMNLSVEGRTYAQDYYNSRPLSPASKVEDATAHLSSSFIADEAFSSNLPLVVLNFEEDVPLTVTVTSDGNLARTGADPWVNGMLEIYDRTDGIENSVSSGPSSITHVRFSRLGLSAQLQAKPQYLLRTVNSTGQDQPVSFFDMSSGTSWVLRGSIADKSMIRNYLVYRVAAQIMEWSPRSQFCEVLIRRNNTLEYEGVYLLCEDVERGVNRVNIREVVPEKKNITPGYLVRRDRFDPKETVLSTYAHENRLDHEYLILQSPVQEEQTEQVISSVEADLSAFEKILYSSSRSRFQKYAEFIDTTSFADYFLVNEFFGNADAGLYETYMYKSSWGKLKMGPVSEFDQAMNNSYVDESSPDSMTMQDRDYFSRLVTDGDFLQKLTNRYVELRAHYLNDNYVFAAIDEAVAHLRSAQKRDWMRWSNNYTDAKGKKAGSYVLGSAYMDGVLVDRYNDDYDQEVYTIKAYLSRHGRYITTRLNGMLAAYTLANRQKGGNAILFVVCLIFFLIPSILINRR